MGSSEAGRKTGEELSPRRWIAVACIGLMHAALMGVLMVPGAYADTFIGGWGVSQEMFVQLTMIGFLTGAVFSIPMGMLADRFGVTRVLGAGMVISLVASLARVFCTSYWPLYASCFVMGIGLAGLNSNSVKFLRAWFGTRQLTTAMTLYVSGAGIGVTAAMGIAAEVPSVHTAFVGASAAFAVACVVWFALARMPRGAAVERDDYSLAAVRAVLKNRTLLLVSAAMVFSMASMAAYSGNVPMGLAGKGLDPATAAAWASLINLFGMPSNWIAGPIADKLRRIKPVMAVSAFGGSALLITAWSLPVGPWSLPLFLAGAIVVWGNVALIKGSVGMIPDIEPRYLGTAGGIQTFFQNLAAFVIPSFVFVPLSGGSMPAYFVLCGVSVIIAGAIMMVAPELGLAGKVHRARDSRADQSSR